MKKSSIFVAGLGGAALAIALAVPANATGYIGGYKSCAGVGSGSVATRGYATGTQSHYHNSYGTVFRYSATYAVKIENKGQRTANWRIETTGTLANSGNYAYCPG